MPGPQWGRAIWPSGRTGHHRDLPPPPAWGPPSEPELAETHSDEVASLSNISHPDSREGPLTGATSRADTAPGNPTAAACHEAAVTRRPLMAGVHLLRATA